MFHDFIVQYRATCIIPRFETPFCKNMITEEDCTASSFGQYHLPGHDYHTPTNCIDVIPHSHTMGDDGCAWFGYNSLHTAQVVNFDIDSDLSFLFGVHTNRGRGVGWILTERGRVKWELMGQKQK